MPQPRNAGHSMTTPPEEHPSSGFLPFLGRLLAVASAIACCWLLYYFARGFMNRQNYVHTRSRRRSARRLFTGRKDAQYSRIGGSSVGGDYQDDHEEEDEGYHDESSVLARPKSWVNSAERPLPDKPLPPLPPSPSSPLPNET